MWQHFIYFSFSFIALSFSPFMVSSLRKIRITLFGSNYAKWLSKFRLLEPNWILYSHINFQGSFIVRHFTWTSKCAKNKLFGLGQRVQCQKHSFSVWQLWDSHDEIWIRSSGTQVEQSYWTALILRQHQQPNGVYICRIDLHSKVFNDIPTPEKINLFPKLTLLNCYWLCL